MRIKLNLESKYGIELRYWVVAIILFSGIFSLMVLAFHDVANEYDAENLTIPEIEENYNQLENQTALVGELRQTVSGEEGLNVFNALGTIFTATIGVLNAVIASIVFIPNVFANFASDFGIPTAVSNIFFTLVGLVMTVLIIFAVLNAIRR